MAKPNEVKKPAEVLKCSLLILDGLSLFTEWESGCVQSHFQQC